MSSSIPPARVRQEDEFFINSLARTYRDAHWSEDELRSIVADALRMIRHLSSRYSDPTCVELNSEELEAEGRKKFIEQFTKVKVLLGLPQRLHVNDLVVAFNGSPVSSPSEIDALCGECQPGNPAEIEYLRWPMKKKDESGVELDTPGAFRSGVVKFTLGVRVAGVAFTEMTASFRKKGAKHENFNPLAVVVKSVDLEESKVYGRVPRPPTRGELFLWFKSCINNHIRGIVHRCRFTVRRTGRKVPSKDSKVDWNRSFKPEVSLEAASEDDHLNRAVERAASVLDSTAVSEFDEDMGLSRYALFEISHPSNVSLTIADLAKGLRLTPNDLPSLAQSYRERIGSITPPGTHQ